MGGFRVIQGRFGWMVEREVIRTKGFWRWKKKFKEWVLCTKEGREAFYEIDPFKHLNYYVHMPCKSKADAERLIIKFLKIEESKKTTNNKKNETRKKKNNEHLPF